MYYILYALLVICPIIQNFFLGKLIGRLGNTPVPIILLIALIMFFVRRKKITIYKEDKLIIHLLLYLFVINIIALFYYFFIKNGALSLLGENVVIKSFKGILYFAFIILYIIIIKNIMKELNTKKIFKPIIVTTIILFILLILEKQYYDFFNNVFQGGEMIKDNRVKLLTSESSFTASMVFIYPILSIYYYFFIRKSKLFSSIFLLIFLIFIYTSDSKSVLINIPIVIILLLIIYYRDILIKKGKNINILRIISIMLLGILLIFIFMPRINVLISSISMDLNQYTSIITRFYTIFVSMILACRYPFGTGNALYLDIFPKALNNNLHMITNLNYNLSEIYSFINAIDDSTIGAKSGVAQYSIYWGILGTVAFLKYIYNYISKLIKSKISGRYMLLFLVIFIVVGIVDFIYFDINYDIFLMLIMIKFVANDMEKEKYS